MTVAIQFEGVRIGGITTSTAAFSFRLNNQGTSVSVQVNRLADFSAIGAEGTVTTGATNADNNYCATCYVSGLRENTKYFWRAVANGEGGPVYGSGPLQSGKFWTLSTKPRPWRLGQLACICGTQIINSRLSSRAFQNFLMSLTKKGANDFKGPILTIWGGDNWYTDIGSNNWGGAYEIGSWFNVTSDDFDIAKLRTTAITTLHGNMKQSTDRYAPAHIAAAAGIIPMPDDHDWCHDNCDGIAVETGDFITRYSLTRKVCHEYMQDLSRDYINAESGRDYVTDARNESTSPAYYYSLDLPPARILVLDTRCLRSARLDSDTPNKTAMGTTQKNWFKSKVLGNPQKFLIIYMPYMMDGDHDWDNYGLVYTDDNWKGYSYERDEIMNYVFKYGDAARTIVLAGDTHCGSVSAYPGYGRKGPRIYEYMTAGFWFPSGHSYPVEYTMDHIKRPDERVCATKVGCSHEFQVDHQPVFNLLEFDGKRISVSMIVVERADSGNATGWCSKTVYQRWYS